MFYFSSSIPLLFIEEFDFSVRCNSVLPIPIPRLDQLPTNDDVTRYYITHMKSKKEPKSKVMRNLSKMTIKIWNAADCCPKSENTVVSMIEGLLKTYWQYKVGRGVASGKHKKKDSDQVQACKPVRRSKRLNCKVPSVENSGHDLASTRYDSS